MFSGRTVVLYQGLRHGVLTMAGHCSKIREESGGGC